MSLERLFADGVLIDLDIRRWSGQKKLVPVDLDLKEEEVPDIFSLGRKYLVPKSVINYFAALEQRARRLLDQNSFAFPIGSTRYVPKNNVLELLQALDQMKEEFYREVDAFINDYDVLREKMKKDYPKYTNSLLPYYPSPAEVRSKFSFNYVIYNISAPAELAEVSKEELLAQRQAFERYKQELDRQVDDFLREVVVQLRAEAAELCAKMADKISKGEVISAKTLKSFYDLTEKYKQMNFVGDTKVEKMLSEFQKKYLTSYSKEASEDYLEQFKGALQNIVKAASNTSDINRVTGGYKRRIKVA